MSELYPWLVKTEDQFRNSPKAVRRARCVWTVTQDEGDSVKDEVWKPSCTNYMLTGPGRWYAWVKHGGDWGNRRVPGFLKPQWTAVKGHWQSKLLWGNFFSRCSTHTSVRVEPNRLTITCGLWAASLLLVVWGQDCNNPFVSWSVFW